MNLDHRYVYDYNFHIILNTFGFEFYTIFSKIAIFLGGRNIFWPPLI